MLGKYPLRSLGILALLLCLFQGVVWADSESQAETAAIAHLVDTVRKSKLTFIRNGESHDGPAAARHILSKYNPSKIKTAEEFISHCASASLTTGKPYLVRFESGRERPLREWLGEELSRWKDSGGRPKKP